MFENVLGKLFEFTIVTQIIEISTQIDRFKNLRNFHEIFIIGSPSKTINSGQKHSVLNNCVQVVIKINFCTSANSAHLRP